MADNSTKTAAIHDGLVALEMSLAGLIALFGIGGNILTIRVLRVPNLRNTSTAFYFTVLAAVDILVLLISPTTKALAAAVYASSIQFRDTHIVMCKLQLFLNYSITQISAWILVAVTIDRMVWVLFPFKARQYCTIRRAKLVSVLIACLVSLINCRHPWYMTLMLNDNNRTFCSSEDEFIRRTYVKYVDPALITIGPFLIMFIANLLIIRKLHQVKAKREKNLHKAPNKRKDGSNLTKMLLCTSIFYLVSSLPYLILTMVLNEKRASILRQKSLALNLIYLGQVCFYSMFNLNYAIHFLLYCLAGPAFKKEAFRLLRIRPQRRGGRANPRDGGGGGGGGGGGDDANGGVTGVTGAGERRTDDGDEIIGEAVECTVQRPDIHAHPDNQEEAVELLDQPAKELQPMP